MSREVLDVLLVEDEARTRQRIERAVTQSPKLRVRAAVGTCASARRQLAEAAPDVLLVDLGLPDGSGIDLIRETRRAHPDARILVISVFGDERSVIESVQAGASGYVLKDGSPDQLAGAILELAEGGAPISAPVARFLLRMVQAQAGDPLQDGPGARDPSLPSLSAREVEVLDLYAKGFSNSEVAELLGVSPHTVVAHGKNIHRKLEVSSRTEAVYEAVSRGLIRLSD